MRAVLAERPGPVSSLRVVERPVPAPGPGEVRIRVAYAACNWGDVQKCQGVYPDPVAYPAVLGAELSGVVSACGAGVRRLRPGTRVAAITGPAMLGGFAEEVCVPVDYCMPLPADFDLRVGAAFPVAGLTAWHLLHSAHHLRKGQTVLIHAIAGGVGLALCQLAAAAGARVLGTVGSPDKAELAREYGAHRVIARDEEDFVLVAMAETDGRGVDLVIDSLGADILPRSFDALRTYGRVINIGEAAGEPDFAVRAKLYERSTSLAGFEVLHAQPGSRRWRNGVRRVLAALAAGQLTIPVGDTLPLAETPTALARLESRATTGKILIEAGGGA